MSASTAPSQDAPEELLAPAFEDAPVGLILADRRGRVIAANAKWREITGFPGSLPMEDHEAWALIHPDDREEVQAAWRDSLIRSTELEVRARMRTPDGQVRWTDTRATPVVGAEDELIGFAGSVLDL